MVHETNRCALNGYAQKVYPGRVTLFLTDDAVSGTPPSKDPRAVWRTLATGGLDLYVVGSHIEDTARQLRRCLDKAMAAQSAIPDEKVSA